MLFQEKCYCYFCRPAVLFGARYAQDVQIRTTSGYANAFSRTSRSFSRLSVFSPRARASLFVATVATLGMQMTAYKPAHACAHETRAQPLPMLPIHMHFNVRSFNDLHNEVICFLSSRMRRSRVLAQRN
jgi:hypothetical protein